MRAQRGGADECLARVGGVADHFEVRFGAEHVAQTAAHHLVVVEQEDPDRELMLILLLVQLLMLLLVRAASRCVPPGAAALRGFTAVPHVAVRHVPPQIPGPAFRCPHTGSASVRLRCRPLSSPSSRNPLAAPQPYALKGRR
ncbi:hypothetical protein GCM10027091_54780 [Streptomyces daliensis]